MPEYVKRLKELKEIVTDAEKTRAEESLYFKRHIAFGIPSVMGSYHEPKFDALAEILRIEEKLRILFEQLKESVNAIYKSWFTDRASQFKRSMRISGYWGTSVTAMQMIYGNDAGSGASVFLTRKPFSLEKGIYGETKERATGGDLVYGRFVNRPLARQQALSDQKSLEEIDPELFLMHKELSERIEQAMRGLPQEVEATYTRRPGLHDQRRHTYQYRWFNGFSLLRPVPDHRSGKRIRISGSRIFNPYDELRARNFVQMFRGSHSEAWILLPQGDMSP